jgi:hypothetical protein
VAAHHRERHTDQAEGEQGGAGERDRERPVALVIAMVWPWGMDVPALPQIVVFAAGVLWFVCSALWRADGGFRLRTLLGSLFRAVMMAAMV